MFLQSVNTFAHLLWSNILKKEGYAIDATCGNGYDTLFLASHLSASPTSKLIALDVQESAIEETQKRLATISQKKFLQQSKLILSNHVDIDLHCPAGADLIVYNLGYLPGSDKSVTTSHQSTLKSLSKAIELLKEGGFISITCYPGHAEGSKESEQVLQWARSLGQDFICCQHNWLNRSEKAPFIVLIEKKLKEPTST